MGALVICERELYFYIVLLFTICTVIISGNDRARTCYQLTESGVTMPDGFYIIDPDGPGGVGEFEVYCEFEPLDPVTGGRNAISYVYLENDLRYNCLYKATPGLSTINYRRSSQGSHVSIAQMKALTAASETCDQYIKYECLGGSALKLSASNHDNFAYWVNGDGDKEYYWGGGTPTDKSCGCHHVDHMACVRSDQRCNCPGADVDRWYMDEGLLIYDSDLPVSKVYVGDVNANQNKKANVLVGALRCYQGNVIKVAEIVDHNCYNGPYVTTTTTTYTPTTSSKLELQVDKSALKEKTVAAVCIPLGIFLVVYFGYLIYLRNESVHDKFSKPSEENGLPET